MTCENCKSLKEELIKIIAILEMCSDFIEDKKTEVDKVLSQNDAKIAQIDTV